MGTALALADPSYSAPALAYHGRAGGVRGRHLVDRRRRLRLRGRARLRGVVPSQRRRRRDLVRLVGVQGCLSQPTSSMTGGRAAPAALPQVRRRRSSREASASASAASSALDGVDLDVRAGPSSGSSGRTAPARRRCSTPPPASAPSTPGRSSSPAPGRIARGAGRLRARPGRAGRLRRAERGRARVRSSTRSGAPASGPHARADVLLTAFGLARPPRPAARNALPRPPPPGECGCGTLARAAADPRRRGDCHARPRGGRRPRRGRRDPRDARMRRPARHPGSALRGLRVPRDRAAASRRRDRPWRAGRPAGTTRSCLPRGGIPGRSR